MILDTKLLFRFEEQTMYTFLKKFKQQIEINSTPYLSGQNLEKWLKPNNIKELAEATLTEDWVLLYYIDEIHYFNAYYISNEHYSSYMSEKIFDYSYMSMDSCITYGYSYENSEKNHFVEKNYERGISRSEMYPLIFNRFFEGFKNTNYLEVLQDIVHFEDLHWIAEKNAFCQINEVGDIYEAIYIEQKENHKLAVINRKLLDKFLLYNKSFLLRFFDINKTVDKGKFTYDLEETKVEIEKLRDNTFKAKYTLCIGKEEDSSYGLTRAIDLYSVTSTIEDMENEDRKFESFIINDFRNNRVTECSTDRTAYDSYFENNGLPFSTSPAFFKPEVLDKYKADPDKYVIEGRLIRCIGGWSIRSLDINDEGQVHVLLCDLATLPHLEQLHWKMYNEKPKGEISIKSFKNDFLGQFDNQRNPKYEIFKNLNILREYQYNDIKLWFEKEDLESQKRRFHPVTSGTESEYSLFLRNLAILTIEGFNKSNLLHILKDKLSETEKKDFGTIALLKVFLEKHLCISPEQTKEIITAFKNLQ